MVWFGGWHNVFCFFDLRFERRFVLPIWQVEFGLVWSGVVWFGSGLGQDGWMGGTTFSGFVFCLVLPSWQVGFGLVCLVWSNLVRCGLVWSGLGRDGQLAQCFLFFRHCTSESAR